MSHSKKLQTTNYKLPTGLLISFDGTDSSGKATQSRLLEKKLQAQGRTVGHFETPDYSKPTGRQLKQLFQGQGGPYTWQQKMALFAANRAEHKQEVADLLAAGGIVIYDRYVPSSLAFVTIEALTENEVNQKRAEVQAAVAQEEYEKNQMPHEDLSIFLDIPPRLAANLLAARQERKQDQAEYTDEVALQERLYREYQHLCRQNPSHYVRIQCLGEHGNLKTVDDIGHAVWQVVADKFSWLKTPPRASQ